MNNTIFENAISVQPNSHQSGIRTELILFFECLSNLSMLFNKLCILFILPYLVVILVFNILVFIKEIVN